MRPITLLALALYASACGDSTPPGPPLTDGGIPDSSVVVGPRDASSGDASGDASDSAVFDATVPFSCTGEPFDLRASAAGSDIEIAVAGSGTDFLVVWTATAASSTEVYARRVPLTGDPGPTWPLTATNEIESAPTVIARGTRWLVAWASDTLAVRDVITYGLDPTDPIGAASVNVSNDAADDAMPRFFASGANSMLMWHRPATSRANVTSVDADGTPGAIAFLDTTTDLFTGPYVVDLGANGLAAVLRTEENTVGVMPLTAAGVSTGAGLSTVTATGATSRLAVSRVGDASRLFVEASSSILMRGFASNGELAGTASSAPTSGTNERAPAAIGLTAAHLLAYRTSMSGTPTLRLATLVAGTGALITDVPITTLGSLDGRVEIARTTAGDILLVYSDTSGSNASVHAVRVQCAGAIP